MLKGSFYCQLDTTWAVRYACTVISSILPMYNKVQMVVVSWHLPPLRLGRVSVNGYVPGYSYSYLPTWWMCDA